MSVSLIFVMFGEIGLVAAVTDVSVYVIFVAVNVALIVLRLRQPGAPRTFRVPLAIREVPVLPIAAIGTVVLMLVFIEPAAWGLAFVALAAGAVLWLGLQQTRRSSSGEA
jgi:APA family basic amino acid/polyamine antiporter